MTIQSRFLFHSAPRPVWWLFLIAALCTQACRADLIVGNADPMNETVSEQRTFVVVSFDVINTGLDPVTITNYIEISSPRFGPADSGDIVYDAIQVIPDGQKACLFSSRAVPLVGLTLASRESCSVFVDFTVIDNDPFDELNPIVDSADWAVLLQVSAKDAVSGVPVSDEIGHAFAHVVDDPVPEPGTATLVLSGLFVVSLLYVRRESRCRVR